MAYDFIPEAVATARPISTEGEQPSFLRDVGSELLNLGGALVLGRARQSVDMEFARHGLNPDPVDVAVSRATATTVAPTDAPSGFPVWGWVLVALAAAALLYLLLRR